MSLTSPNLLLITLAVALATLALIYLRRIALPRPSIGCFAIGMLLLALAAGGLTIRRPDPRQAVVMVDLSPSTRTATYRDPAAREARIRQLLGEVGYTVRTFAEGEQVEQTRFPSESADAIVLLSDAQFELPDSAPPTYIVVDPNLEQPIDASIRDLEPRSNEVVAIVQSSGNLRSIDFTGATGPTTVPAGRSAIAAKIDPAASVIAVRLDSADPWPENDSLSLRPPTRGQQEMWWLTQASSPAAFRAMQPGDLPTEPAAYLIPELIVLDNLPASALSPAQQQRLVQYVRDLGGGLVIFGGDQAFAAGGYLGTPLDSLSPLASAPSQQQRQWIILVDASGSMAGDAGGQTRWQRAASAIPQLLAALPPQDPVSVGSFARDLRWWSQGKSAADTAAVPIPQDIVPSGPTNLQPILTALAAQLRPGNPTEIILISDADALIDDPFALTSAFRPRRASVNLLLTGNNPQSPLMQVVALTAGNMIPQADPSLWAADAIKLARSTMQDYLVRAPAMLGFTGPLQSLAQRETPLWNRTWIKSSATELAWIPENNARIASAATWRVGSGVVAATAFSPAPPEVDAIAALVRQPPRDPRFKVSHSITSMLGIQVDAADPQRPLNDLPITLSLVDESQPLRPVQITPFSQIAPGRYEIAIPAPRSPSLAVIRAQDQLIDRFAIAGRYPPEFDSIGNNRQAMNDLAASSGGAVIEPSQTTPIDFNWPPRQVSLVSLCSIAAAALIALGLIVWKLR